MCLQARGMGVYRSIGRSHCTRSKCLEHGRRPCCCQWCNMLLRVAQCPACHPWGGGGARSSHRSRGRRGGTRRRARRSQGMVVGSKMQRESAGGPRGSRPVHSIEGGRRSARRVKLHIEACLSRAFMLVRAKSYRHATPFYPGACPRATAPPIASGGAGWAGAESWAAAGAPALSLRAPSVASSGLSGGVSIAPASPGAHTLMCSHNGQYLLK